MHNGIAERPERKPLSVRDPVRKKLILDTKRENPSMKATEIAKIADCGPGYVRKVLKDVKANLHEAALPALPVPEAGHGAQVEPGAASNPKWFQRAVAEADSAALIAGLDPLLERLRRGEKSPKLSTDLRDPLRVRVITDQELKDNTFPHDLKKSSVDSKELARSREWLRYHFSASKRSTQGFIIMAAHIEDDDAPSAVLFERFPELLDKNKFYAKELKTIFQTLQAKKPKGDGKRVQAKMTALIDLSKVRLKEAKGVVELRKKRNRPPATLPKALQDQESRKKRKRPSANLSKALQDLEDIQKEHDLIRDVTYAMGRGYARIQQVPAFKRRIALLPSWITADHVCGRCGPDPSICRKPFPTRTGSPR